MKPSECIVMEDSLAGMKAAAAAGMVCIALTTTLPKKEVKGKAALIVKDFRSPHLRRLLSALFKRR